MIVYTITQTLLLYNLNGWRVTYWERFKNPYKRLYLRNTFLNISKKYIYFISIDLVKPFQLNFVSHREWISRPRKIQASDLSPFSHFHCACCSAPFAVSFCAGYPLSVAHHHTLTESPTLWHPLNYIACFVCCCRGGENEGFPWEVGGGGSGDRPASLYF